MIFYNLARKYPTQLNVLTLKGNTTGYFYVHRCVYDDALLIRNLFPQDFTLSPTHNINAIHKFCREAPAPLNSLGMFLSLVTEDLDDELDSYTIEHLTGILSVISSVIGFKKYLDTPVEIRRALVFSVSAIEEYLMPYDAFFMSCLDTLVHSSNVPTGLITEETDTKSVSMNEPVLETEEQIITYLDEPVDWDNLPEMDLDSMPAPTPEEIAMYKRLNGEDVDIPEQEDKVQASPMKNLLAAVLEKAK